MGSADFSVFKFAVAPVPVCGGVHAKMIRKEAARRRYHRLPPASSTGGMVLKRRHDDILRCHRLQQYRDDGVSNKRLRVSHIVSG